MQTTLKKLLSSIVKSSDFNIYSIQGFSAGIVTYHNQTYFNKLLNDIRFSQIISDANGFMISSLFLKRLEFYHEQEVRIIIRDSIDIEKEFENEIIKPFSVDIDELIDEVTFDPRCDIRFYETYKSVINQCGYNGLINKSELYSLNN